MPVDPAKFMEQVRTVVNPLVYASVYAPLKNWADKAASSIDELPLFGAVEVTIGDDIHQKITATWKSGSKILHLHFYPKIIEYEYITDTKRSGVFPYSDLENACSTLKLLQKAD